MGNVSGTSIQVASSYASTSCEVVPFTDAR
jgi:hypothetical protein